MFQTNQKWISSITITFDFMDVNKHWENVNTHLLVAIRLWITQKLVIDFCPVVYEMWHLQRDRHLHLNYWPAKMFATSDASLVYHRKWIQFRGSEQISRCYNGLIYEKYVEHWNRRFWRDDFCAGINLWPIANQDWDYHIKTSFL